MNLMTNSKSTLVYSNYSLVYWKLQICKLCVRDTQGGEPFRSEA